MSDDVRSRLAQTLKVPDALKKQLDTLKHLAQSFKVPDWIKLQREQAERLTRSFEKQLEQAERLAQSFKVPDWIKMQREQAERLTRMPTLKHPLLQEAISVETKRADVLGRLASLPKEEKQSLKDAVKAALREIEAENRAAAKAAVPAHKEAGFVKKDRDE